MLHPHLDAIALLTVVASLLACSKTPSAIEPEYEDDPLNPVLIRDTFSRTVTKGWGNPDRGGSWRTNHSEDFSVANGFGWVLKSDSTMRTAVASHGYGMDVSGMVSFAIDTQPDNPSRFYTVQVYARRNDRRAGRGDYHYRFRVRAFGTGQMDLAVDRTVDDQTTALGPITDSTTLWGVGQKYWLRWEVQGTSPDVTLKLRIWVDGDPEPVGWELQASSDEPLLDATGTSGFRVSGPNGGAHQTYPVRFSFSDFEYRRIAD